MLCTDPAEEQRVRKALLELPADSALVEVWGKWFQEVEDPSLTQAENYVEPGQFRWLVNRFSLLEDFSDYLAALREYARRHGQTNGWSRLRRRLATEWRGGSAGAYRTVVSAIFEASILGFSVRHWGEGVSLWPEVNKRARAELMVESEDLTFCGEAACTWKELDSHVQTRALRPEQELLDREVTRLLREVKKKCRQLAEGVTGVVFLHEFYLTYPGFYPGGKYRRAAVAARVQSKFNSEPTLADVVLLLFRNWRLDSVVHADLHQDCGEVVRRLAGVLNDAFGLRWFAAPQRREEL